MRKKFVGDKASIEATSLDGRIWEIQLFDRGHVTKFIDASVVELNELVAKKGMRLVPGRE